ncbi:MAG: hypothetical protein KZQ62_05590 [Candidatus Thiodiazotropha sp. (ex Lucinoma aequizonata)]|nr:hypothetical protein [Candidatus Thiodiazotropha sp. (ex Lucinoma aequizonata)]MCU7900308.1 hypothetical protein [Candidatus Thiodiazotropha sp. (ex Lucinoma aequizonata)]
MTDFGCNHSRLAAAGTSEYQQGTIDVVNRCLLTRIKIGHGLHHFHRDVQLRVGRYTRSRGGKDYAVRRFISTAVVACYDAIRVIIQLKNWKKCLTRFFCIFSNFEENCLPASITIHTSSKRLAMGFFYR